MDLSVLPIIYGGDFLIINWNTSAIKTLLKPYRHSIEGLSRQASLIIKDDKRLTPEEEREMSKFLKLYEDDRRDTPAGANA